MAAALSMPDRKKCMGAVRSVKLTWASRSEDCDWAGIVNASKLIAKQKEYIDFIYSS